MALFVSGYTKEIGSEIFQPNVRKIEAFMLFKDFHNNLVLTG